MPTNPSDVTYEIDPAQSDAVSFGQVLGARGDVNFEESGSLTLTAGELDLEITFIWQKETADYRFEYCYIEDSNGQPEDIRAVVNERTTTGFTLKLSAAPDTNLSILRWKVTTPDGLHLTQPPTSQPRYVLAGEYQPLAPNLTTLAGLSLVGYGMGFLSLANEAAARTYINAQIHSANLDTWSAYTPSFFGGNLILAPTATEFSFMSTSALGTLTYYNPAQLLATIGAIQGVTVAVNNGITVAGSGTGSITLGLDTITPTAIEINSGLILIGAMGGAFDIDVAANAATHGFALHQNNLASAGVQRYSPYSAWRGSGWKTNATAAAENVEFRAYTVPIQGVSHPTGYFLLESSVNNGSFSNGLRLYASGGLNLGGTADPGTSNMSIEGAFYGLSGVFIGPMVSSIVVTGAITGTNLVLSGNITSAVNIAASGTITAAGSLISATSLIVGGLQVVGPRSTGWTLGTGTPSQGAINYDSATLGQLSARVKALEDMLRIHGLIN